MQAWAPWLAFSRFLSATDGNKTGIEFAVWRTVFFLANQKSYGCLVRPFERVVADRAWPRPSECKWAPLVSNSISGASASYTYISNPGLAKPNFHSARARRDATALRMMSNTGLDVLKCNRFSQKNSSSRIVIVRIVFSRRKRG